MSMCPAQEAESPEEKVWSLIAKCCASMVMLGIWAGWYPLMHRYPVAASQEPPGMFCQPSIFPPSIAAAWAATLWFTFGTVSGSVVGVTTVPLDSRTEDGIPPSGQ